MCSCEDSITLSEELKLTAGIKFEDNSYSDWSTLPDLRLSWAPNDKTLFWLAGSRAIRAPTPFDTDVQEFVGGQLFVLGDPDFKPEKVTAYELGYRGNPDATLSLSASMFYNEYDDLRTIEITPGGLPAAALGQSDGRQRLWLRSLGRHSDHARGGAFRRAFARCTRTWSSARARRRSWACARRATIPSSQYYLKSSMDLRRFTFDVMVRKVGALPDPALDDYTELNARFAWRATEQLELAVKGFNLLNETHLEYPDPAGQGIRRSVMAELRYNY